MPRIPATLLYLALVVAALWWNIVSYPVVGQMLAPQEHGQQHNMVAVAAERPESNPPRSAVEQPQTAKAHTSSSQGEPAKPRQPLLAMSTDASPQPTAAIAPAPQEKPSESTLAGKPSASDAQVENSERRYPPEPFLVEAAVPSAASGCKDGCCPIKPQAAGAVGGDPTARQTSGAPLQWLSPGKQHAESTAPSQQQAAPTAAKSSGTSLPAVVAGFSRVAQEVSGPVPIQPASHPGALVPVSRDSQSTDSATFQVRRLPPIEDEEQPTAVSSSVASEAPTTYPSTGID